MRPTPAAGPALLFFSQTFVVFFATVFTVYWLLPWHRGRLLWLLGASFVFYASWNHWLAALIAASTTVDYAIGRAIAASRSASLRRGLLVTSIAANLGILAYFKYVNFFLGSLGAALHAVGLSASFPVLQVILPIGISFYTFEAISYVIDVHRGTIAAERSLVRFMLFITFFPHLVAGPIVRPRYLLVQLREPKRWDWLRLELGMQYFLLGLFKKLVIADRMAMFADPVFAEPLRYGSAAVWTATLAYTVQIYCDFSGYSDMAVGLAHTLGYKLPRNFDRPYLAASVSEFWRRWHVSLSTWLRDYLFIPLGGSRTPERWQTTRNLLVTMTLGGLWHGAAPTFVAWGFFHGCLLVGHHRWRERSEHWPHLVRFLETPAGRALATLTTLGCVMVGWVLFRATSLAASAQILARLVVPHGGLGAPLPYASLVFLLTTVAIGHALGGRRVRRGLGPRASGAMLGVGYAAAAAATLLLTPETTKPFIYFQF